MTDPDLALPAGYATLLEDLKRDVAATRWRAQQVVNTGSWHLYRRLGHAILDRQKAEGWGTRVIDRLAADLRAAFPQHLGLSRSNLFYMRSVAAAWPEQAVVQQPVGRLPWGHITVLLDKLNDRTERDCTPPPPSSTAGPATC